MGKTLTHNGQKYLVLTTYKVNEHLIYLKTKNYRSKIVYFRFLNGNIQEIRKYTYKGAIKPAE